MVFVIFGAILVFGIIEAGASPISAEVRIDRRHYRDGLSNEIYTPKNLVRGDDDDDDDDGDDGRDDREDRDDRNEYNDREDCDDRDKARRKKCKKRKCGKKHKSKKNGKKRCRGDDGCDDDR